MKILLDENFPLPLYHKLQALGIDVEHIIVLGQRGLDDSSIRKRLTLEKLLFLSHDTEFLDSAANFQSTVLISRVRQSRFINERVKIWTDAIQKFLAKPIRGNLFELLDTGEIIPTEIH